MPGGNKRSYTYTKTNLHPPSAVWWPTWAITVYYHTVLCLVDNEIDLLLF